MAKVLLVGCGQLGTAIAVALHHAGFEVIGLRKSQQALPHDMQTIQADVLDMSTLRIVESLKPDYLIYCLSATERTDESYQQYYVEGLRNILATQVNNTHLKHQFFISSTRVYGQEMDELLNENTKAVPKDYGGKRLLEAENLLSTTHKNSTVFRLTGIYGLNRLYLVRMAKDLNKWPETNGWSNRIHQHDAAGFIAYMLKQVAEKPIASLYVVTDSEPTKQYDVLTWLAQNMHLKTKAVPESKQLKGKRLSNQRLLETGYVLKYPSYQIGYAEILDHLN